jgi:5-methylthioadenosine/S-adenosylhomocysteine deaminase
MPETRTVIRDGVIVTMNPTGDILEGGTVVIEDDRIAAVLPKGVWKGEGTEQVIEALGMVVIPGLVNSHLHSRPFRALGDGLSTSEWHNRYAQTLSALMNEESTYWGALWAFAENIKGGVTCVADMPPWVAGSDRAAWEIGIRAILLPHGGSAPNRKKANENLETSIANIQRLGDQSGNRVKIWFGFGHPSECDKEYYKMMREYATRFKTGICGHVSSSRKEVALYAGIYGTEAIVEYFHESGFLGKDVVLVHGVLLTPNEIRLMAETGTALSHCPSSVMRVGHKVTPVIEMLEAGVNLGLGTDGPLSSYRMDMFEIMRLSCFLQRIHKSDGSVMPGQKALELATRGGAKILGIEDEVGSLEKGKRADITLINFEQPHLTPLNTEKHSNLIALLVFSCSAGDVDTVIIDGKVVMKGRKLLTVNEEEILSKVKELASRTLAKVS